MVDIAISNGALALIISLLVAPPVCMFITSFLIRKNNRNAAKNLFIIGIIYLLVCLAIYCFIFVKLFLNLTQ